MTLLKAARDHRLYALWLLLASTGLRRGEVLGLTWADVDPTNGQLRVRRNLRRIKRELIFGTPKTMRSVRTVSLPQQPSGLIFTTATGRATDPRSPNRMLTVLCRNAEIRRVRVHDLRHTCASLLLAQGVDARTVMETLGHSTITLDTYARVMHTALRAAADRMDDALGPDEEDGDDGDAVSLAVGLDAGPNHVDVSR
ncbi:site-specific integrase [Actinacidiphila glaucinigra]|uniref:site-specific integrase n=1 Tax=Actinacidiphila glaucinigra TaxID=235986 RepID=UPI0036E4FC3A